MLFLDVRLSSVGGGLAASVAIGEVTAAGAYQSASLAQLLSAVDGHHVLIGTHGFNVNRPDGVAHLSNWQTLLQLPQPSVFIGVLWPGDSVWAHGLDYPDEPRIANRAGELLGPFIDAHFQAAASVSFASHSLGARVVLSTLSHMSTPVRRVTLMAGAIDDDCLNKEFRTSAAKVGEISVLASKKDAVLSTLFPLGNVFGGIIAAGHPWWHGALGRSGPANPRPLNVRAPFQIPDNWSYGHGDYLRIDPPPAAIVAIPTDVPANGSNPPAMGAAGWKEAWSAALSSTRFQ